jgi:hypothetical protein
VAVADITGVRTTFEVSMDVGAMYERQQTVDPASLLALAGSLMEAGYGVVLWQELLAIRDTPLGNLAELQERCGQAIVRQATAPAGGLIVPTNAELEKPWHQERPPQAAERKKQ